MANETIRVAVAPEAGDGRGVSRRGDAARRVLVDAGFEIVLPENADGLVWVGIFDPDGLQAALDVSPHVRWVQLPRTGVDNFLPIIRSRNDITFTCTKGAYAPEVAEHALMLALAVMRKAVEHARSAKWDQLEPVSLENKRVTIVGGGYVCERLIELIGPFGCDVTVARRTDVPVAGARRTVGQASLHEVLSDTDVLFLALSLTPDTEGLIGADELAAMPEGSYVINVARGAHVDDAALADAIGSGHIAGAGLDVTLPEPLPEENRLWSMDNVLITSHSANSVAYMVRRLAERSVDNARRLQAGKELVGVVDAEAGY